jgi:hypothetical protein
MAFFASAAIAAPEDDYVIYKTATEINKACGGLKFLEHQRTLGAAQDALADTPQYGMLNDGRLPQADYEAWFAELEAKVAAQVQAVGCSEQALPFLTRGRGVASEEIYRGLVLAVHFGGLPPTDIMNYVELEPDRYAALQRYDGYLQALYRENFVAFSARQKERATQDLPMYNLFGDSDDYGLGLGALMTSPEDATKISNAHSLASTSVDAVFFEVMAETAGFIVRPRTVQEYWTLPELRPAAAVAEPGLVVVNGPGYDLIDFTPADGNSDLTKLYSALALKPDSGLRVMYYGDAAAPLVDGTVRLYVRTAPLPEGASSYESFASPAFRDSVATFDGVPVASGCLSAACFDFPPEATELFVKDKANEYAEIFVSPLAEAQPEVTDGKMNYKPGRVSNFYAYKLLRE